VTRFISLDCLNDKDPGHPKAGLDGSALDSEERTETLATLLVTFTVDVLADQEKELMYALFWDMRTTREVARELGVAQSTVVRRKRRVSEKLRSLLEDVY
jgi:DNA-directed RNA polymerase specialized sigma subunit